MKERLAASLLALGYLLVSTELTVVLFALLPESPAPSEHALAGCACPEDADCGPECCCAPTDGDGGATSDARYARFLAAACCPSGHEPEGASIVRGPLLGPHHVPPSLASKFPALPAAAASTPPLSRPPARHPQPPDHVPL